jgi:hypothetical protein
MKTLIRYSILLMLVIAVPVMTGCEKDDDKKDNGPDKESLLTAHIWKFSSLSSTSTDQDVQLFVSMMSIFMTNATLEFGKDGSYTMTLPALETSDTGTWKLSSDGTKLTITTGGEQAVSTISKLTSDEFEFKETVDEEGMPAFEVTYTWVK